MTTRRNFLFRSTAIGAMLPIAPVFGKTSTAALADQLPAEVVKEFVSVAHNDFDRTKAILNEYPHATNAAWDWGDGDFESAIGAAGHMGRKDIALFLLGNGARADIFVLTMLGETTLVKALIARFPHLLHSLGPHGFTLLHHAQKGGEPAAELFNFFNENGLTETFVKYFKD